MKSPKPLSPRLKRLLAYLLAGLFLLAVLLHLPPTKRLLRPIVSTTLSWAVGGSVELGALDYALWRGELELSDLRIVPDRTRLPFELAAQRAELRVSPLGRVRVRLDTPELTLFQQEGSAVTSRSSFLTRLNPLTLLRLELANGTVRVLSPADELWGEIRSVELDLEWLLDHYRAQVNATNGTLDSDSAEILFGPLEGVFEMRGSELRVVSSRVEKGDSRVEWNGTATSLDPFLGHFDADFRVDAEILRELNPEADVRGILEGSARLDGESDGGTRISADFRSAGLAWNGFEPWGMTAEATLADGSLRFENVSLTGYGGTVQAAAQIDLAQQRQAVQIDFDGLDLRRTVGDLAGRNVPLASHATGRLELSTTQWNLQTAEGAGRATLEPSDAEEGSLSFPAGGEVLLTLREGTATLEAQRLSIPQGEIELTARLQPIDPSGRIDTTYRIQIDDVGVVARLLPEMSALVDAIDLEGGVTAQGRASGPLADVSWNAVLTSQNLRLLGDPFALDAQLGLTRDRLRVDTLSLHDPRGTERVGTVVVEGEVPLAPRAGSWELRGELDSLDIERLSPLIGAPVEGLATGRFEITGDFSDPDWRAEIRTTGLRLPHDGEVSVALQKRGRDLLIERLRLTSPAGSLEASGSYQLDHNQVAANVRAREIRLTDLPLLTENLGEIDGVIDSLEAELQGPLMTPSGVLRLVVREPSFRGLALPGLTVESTSDGEIAELRVHLEDERRLLSARGELQSPYPIEASFDLSALPLERLLQSDLLLGDPDVFAQAWGELELAFPLFEPNEIQYRVNVEQLVGSYHGIGGGAGSPFLIEGDLQSFRIEALDLIGNQTAIAVSGRIPLRADEEFDLRLRGDARLELLAPAFEGVELAGRASADLHLRGPLDRLDLAGDVAIQEAESTIHGVHLSDVSASVEGSAGRVQLRSLTGRLLGGEFRMQGELPLPSAQSSDMTRLQFDITELDMAGLLFAEWDERDEWDDASKPVLKVSASGSLEAPTLSVAALSGSGAISRIEAGFGPLAIANAEPAAWSLAMGRLELPELRLAEGDTDLRIGMIATLAESDLAWEATIRGRADNELLNPLIGADGVVVSGTTELDLGARSTPEGFLFEGTGSLRETRVVVREPPLVFSDVRGEMRFEDQRITLAGVSAEVGGGRIEGSGTIDALGPIDLSLAAESVRLNYPEGLRSTQSGSFRLSGGPETYLLSGDISLLQSLYNRDVTFRAETLDSLRGNLAPLTPEDSFSERLRLEMRAQTVEDLRIDNNVARLQAAGNILVSGTLAAPEIDGLLTARPDGIFRFGRNNYRIVSGRLVLRGYPTETPELDLVMRTTVADIDIETQMRGPLDDLHTELSAPESTEDFTRSDLAALLATGRTLDNVSIQQQRIVTEQLVSFLSGSLAGLAERGIAQVLPFQSISVDPARIASEVDPQARFTIGVGVTEELTVTYSVALDDSQSRLWVVDYLLPKNIELRGSQLEDEFTGAVSQKLFFDFHQRSAARRAESRLNVGLIRVVGAPFGLEDSLKREIGTQAGDRYDYWRTLEDVRRLRGIVRQQGYLGVLVDVETVPFEEGLIDIVFRVDPGSPIEIVWQGDDPGSGIREEVANAWDGVVPESFLVTELASLAVRALQRESYYQAEVEATLEDAPDGARRAVFRVSRGPRSAGLDIEFEGNDVLSDLELRAALPPDSSPELLELVFTNRRRLRQTVERFYASRGFLDARAGQPMEEAGRAGERFRITIPVEEGEPSQVASIELDGATSISVATLFDQLSLRVGEPFRSSQYQQDRTTLSSIYRREGFVEVRVRGNLTRAAEGLAVVFKIDEGPRAVVGTIRIVGNRTTRTSLIRRQLTFQEGDPVRLSDFTDSQTRLHDLGIFRSADLRMEPVEAGAIERDVIVEVIEISDLNVSYGLRYNSEENFQILTQLGAPNVFGGGQHVGLTIRADSNESLVRGTFHTPYLFTRFHLGTDIFVSRETEDTEFFFDQIWSLTFQQTRPLNDWMDLQWNYSFRRVRTVGKIDEGPIPFDFTVYKNLLGTSLIEDRRDSLFRPTRGRFWNVTLQGTPSQLNNDITFIKTFGQLITFVSLGHNLVWAASYRLGIADAFDQFLPPDDRFTAGGVDSVRGFAQDSLGPEDPITDTAIGGEGIAVFNQELRFPIFRWFHGGAFFDAGNVYLNASDFNPFDLRYSAGAGIRLVLPFGLLRFDWARAFDRRPEEKAYQYWFSFGHAF